MYLINHGINLFWTALFFAPVILVWVRYYDATIFFFLLGFSLVPLFMNEALLQLLQLSKDRKFYERLGIKKFQAITQNGKIANNRISRKQPGYRVISSRRNLEAFKLQIMIYEKYHLIGLLFFTGSTIHALINSAYYLSVWIFISNICYNVIPLLIQQYNKSRIQNCRQKSLVK